LFALLPEVPPPSLISLLLSRVGPSWLLLRHRGDHPIHYAALTFPADSIRLLVDADGGVLEQRGERGATALRVAGWRDRPADVMEALEPRKPTPAAAPEPAPAPEPGAAKPPPTPASPAAPAPDAKRAAHEEEQGGGGKRAKAKGAGGAGD
ncbi:hypothetical protein TeGR_g3201, partial [Tetraparma gracilis]